MTSEEKEEGCEESEEFVVKECIIEKHLGKVVGHLIEEEINELQKDPEYSLKTRDQIKTIIMCRLKNLRKGGY